MRSMASIETIQQIIPIRNNELVEIARILGWNVLVKKDRYQSGEKVVYIRIGSKLPPKHPFMFMASKNFVVRTIYYGKLGLFSQGLVFKLACFNENVPKNIGADLTKVLGIERAKPDYERVAEKGGKIKEMWRKFFGYDGANFAPPFTSKRKILEKLQNVPIAFSESRTWDVTEKLEGVYVNYIMRKNDRHLHVLSKYSIVERNCSVYWNVAYEFHIQQKLKKLLKRNKKLKWVSIEAIIIGKGIKRNVYGKNENEIYIFNYGDNCCPKSGCEEGKRIVESVALSWVPIVGHYKYGIDDYESVIEQADGKSAIYDGARVGTIITSENDSFSITSNKFLVEQSEKERRRE